VLKPEVMLRSPSRHVSNRRRRFRAAKARMPDWTGELVKRFPKAATSQAQLLRARWCDKQKYESALKRCGWVLDAKVPEAQAMASTLAASAR